MSKKNYSFRFKEDIMDKIQELADEENRTGTNLIETVLIDHIKKAKRKKKRNEKMV